MARPRNSQPTDGELEILKLLWNAGPCALGHVCSLLRRERPVATTTVATMLSVMLGKPTLEDVFIRRTGHKFWSEREVRP